MKEWTLFTDIFQGQAFLTPKLSDLIPIYLWISCKCFRYYPQIHFYVKDFLQNFFNLILEMGVTINYGTIAKNMQQIQKRRFSQNRFQNEIFFNLTYTLYNLFY